MSPHVQVAESFNQVLHNLGVDGASSTDMAARGSLLSSDLLLSFAISSIPISMTTTPTKTIRTDV